MCRLSIQIFLLLALISGIFWRMFSNLMSLWFSDMDYSHCILIPLVSVYIMYEKRHQLRRCKITGFWPALSMVIFSCFLAFWGILTNQPFSQHASFVFMVVSLIAFNFGLNITKVLGFSLFLLIFMFPLPHMLKAGITFPLQIISSKAAADLLRFIGISAYRDGNIIDLGTTQLEIVEACSGLRFIISLLVLAVLVGYFFQNKFWKRIVLFMSAIPIAVASNVLRIVATGMLARKFGQKVTEGFFHSFSGWLVFIFSFVVLTGENFLLNLKDRKKKETRIPENIYCAHEEIEPINKIKFAVSAFSMSFVIAALFFFTNGIF